jgi:hypothetical protein
VKVRVVERGFRRVVTVVVVAGTAIAAADGDVVVADVRTTLSPPSLEVSPVVVVAVGVPAIEVIDGDRVGDDGDDNNPSVAIDRALTLLDTAVVVAVVVPLPYPIPSIPVVATAPVATTGATVVAPLDGCLDEGRVGVVYTLIVGDGGRKCFLSGTQP